MPRVRPRPDASSEASRIGKTSVRHSSHRSSQAGPINRMDDVRSSPPAIIASARDQNSAMRASRSSLSHTPYAIGAAFTPNDSSPTPASEDDAVYGQKRSSPGARVRSTHARVRASTSCAGGDDGESGRGRRAAPAAIGRAASTIAATGASPGSARRRSTLLAKAPTGSSSIKAVSAADKRGSASTAALPASLVEMSHFQKRCCVAAPRSTSTHVMASVTSSSAAPSFVR
mmetsp:Transcript_44885/g.117747  ORF Transcript_44885/g.117747 Transcript_44885/m.117747 type:complete len:230 (-) Transcript_44885:77-766(-)